MRLLMLLVLAALPATAQEVVLRPAFEEGRVDRYRLEASISLEQTGEEAVPPRTLEQSVELRFRTASVDDSGRAVVTMKIDRVEVTLTEDAEIQQHQWPMVEAVVPNDLARAWQPLVDTVLRFGVDTQGRIHVGGSADAIAERIDELEIDDARAMLGLLAPEVIDRTFALVWRFDDDPGARAPGDAWIIDERIAFSGERYARLSRACTLDAIDDDHATIDMQITLMGLDPERPTLVEADIAGEGTGQATWNHTRSILERLREEIEIVLEASLGDRDPITTRLTRRWSLKRLEDDS